MSFLGDQTLTQLNMYLTLKRRLKAEALHNKQQ